MSEYKRCDALSKYVAPGTSCINERVSVMLYHPAFDTRTTLTYNIWPRSPQPTWPGAIGTSARARNHYERSVNFSATTTKTQAIQRATESATQPRCPETHTPRCLPAMSRNALASPGLPFVRHLSRSQGNRDQGQEKIQIDHSLLGETISRPCRSGFACTALIVSAQSGDSHL